VISPLPVAHFAPQRNWLNDPNGLLYADGVFHLFFQHNPEGDLWGNMSWGHATSPDLVSWTEQPVAISHDAREGVYSGSAVLDVHNTSGFGTADNPPMVAVYTSAYSAATGREGVQAQSLAYSTDGGQTWTKDAGNPGLDRDARDFRDPKVFWFEPDQSWRMVVAMPTEHRVSIYASPNLRDWTHLSDVGGRGARSGAWECPDLFPLAVDGDPSRVLWVLLVSLTPGTLPGPSGTQYFVGDFDGTTFTPVTDEDEVAWLDLGRDNYAGVTFNGIADGRRILVGWMGNWQYAEAVPTASWRGQMTAPRQLTLVSGPHGPRLAQELVGIGGLTRGQKSQVVRAGTSVALPGGAAYVQVHVDLGAAAQAGIELRGSDGALTRIVVAADPPRLLVVRSRSGASVHELFPSVETAPLDPGEAELRILVDRYSVEVLAQDGTASVTDLVFPDGGHASVALVSSGGAPQALWASVTPISR
jgi:sucrose-6-phosphate hydrolase SacC (GH32 family)